MTAAEANSTTDHARRAPSLDADCARNLYGLIGQTSLVSGEQALLVSIGAVKESLGERWASRQDQIYELVDRYFRRRLSPTDICQPASETYFLIATPDRPKVYAQAAAYRASKDVFSFFVNDSRPSDVEVNLITQLSPDRVGMRLCTLAELEQAAAEVDQLSSTAQTPSPNGDFGSWSITTADGQMLRVSFAVDPVMDLRAGAIAGHRVDSRLVNVQTGADLAPAQRRELLPRDFERIDLAALERGASRLSAAEAGPGAGASDMPSLIIQVSCESLSHARTRKALLDRAGELGQVLKRAAICELTGLMPGMQAAQVAELINHVRPYFRSVWAQVLPNRGLIEAVRAAKVSGMTIRALDLEGHASQSDRMMRGLMAIAADQGALLTLTGIPARGMLVDARGLGFTHATLRARADAA